MHTVDIDYWPQRPGGFDRTAPEQGEALIQAVAATDHAPAHTRAADQWPQSGSDAY